MAPKIKAKAGTTIIETPGTPTFDIPISIPQTTMATLAVMVLMVALSAAWLRWKARKAERLKAATTVAQGRAQPSTA